MSTVEAEVVDVETEDRPESPGRELAVIVPASHDAETLARIVELNTDVIRATASPARITIKKKAAQEVLAECQARLDDFIAEIGREYPLFDGVTSNGQVREIKPEPEKTPEPDELARLEAIGILADFGLSGAIIAKLVEAGIPSIGAMADWTAPPPRGQGKTLNHLPGIGFSKAEKINAALEAFWASRRGGPLDVERELAEGCREVEKDRSKFDPAWRATPVEDLGLAAATIQVLRDSGIATADLLHALAAQGNLADVTGISVEAFDEIEAALKRLRNRLSNAGIADYDRFFDAEFNRPHDAAEGEDA